jgi:outer membrane protein assembly factor BamB
MTSRNQPIRPAVPLIRAAGLCLILLHACCVARADSWPRFRGPNGTGVSELRGVPTQWSENDYEWVVELPGSGHSSPVVWDEALFLTTGQADGTRTIHRYDAFSGAEVWSRSIRLQPDQLHKKNSHASGTPAVDAERVYVPFADDEHYLVLAYGFDGEQVWSYDLGPFLSQHGQGMSPIVYHGLLIVPNDQDGPSSVVALDCASGEEVWRAPRPSKVVSYATPFVLELPDRAPQLVCLSGAAGLAGLDPLTGAQIWTSGELPLRTVASPVYGNGVVIATCGEKGVGKYFVAVDPTGQGDVSQTHVRYRRAESETLHYVPTPIVRGQYLYLWCDLGIVCCVEMASGKTIWRERIGDNYSGSPVMIDGRLYALSESGEVAVVAAEPEFRDYGRSPLGAGSHSTPAVANGRVYFRGFNRLASLKARGSDASGGSGP